MDSGSNRGEGVSLFSDGNRGERQGCRWGSTTAITATSNSRTPPAPASAISRASPTSAPKLSEPNQAYAEGYVRGVCNRFVNTGFCQYGDSCKYFHPKSVSTPAPRTAGGNAQSMVIPGSHLVGGTSSQGNVVVADGTGTATAWGNLPPSLKPPPEGGYPSLPFIDWG